MRQMKKRQHDIRRNCCPRAVARSVSHTFDRILDRVNMSKLDEIEARLNAATPGPWQWEIDSADNTETLVTTDETVVGGAVLWAQDKNNYGAHIRVTPEDAALIAHTRG